MDESDSIRIRPKPQGAQKLRNIYVQKEENPQNSDLNTEGSFLILKQNQPMRLPQQTISAYGNGARNLNKVFDKRNLSIKKNLPHPEYNTENENFKYQIVQSRRTISGQKLNLQSSRPKTSMNVMAQSSRNISAYNSGSLSGEFRPGTAAMEERSLSQHLMNKFQEEKLPLVMKPKGNFYTRNVANFETNKYEEQSYRNRNKSTHSFGGHFDDKSVSLRLNNDIKRQHHKTNYFVELSNNTNSENNNSKINTLNQTQLPKYHAKYIDLIVKFEQIEGQNLELKRERDQLKLKINKYDEILSNEISDTILKNQILSLSDQCSKSQIQIQEMHTSTLQINEMKQKQSDLIQEIQKLNDIISNLQEAQKKTFSNDYMDSDDTMRNKSAQAKYESKDSSLNVDDSQYHSEIQIIQNLIRQHDQQIDIMNQSKIKIQEENSKFKVRNQNLQEQLQKIKKDHRETLKKLNEKITQLEEHQRSSIDDEILNSPKNDQKAGGTGSSGQSDNAKSPIMKIVEISNDQMEGLTNKIKELESDKQMLGEKIQQMESEKQILLNQKEKIENEKQKLETEKTKLESEKDQLKVQIVDQEMNKTSSNESLELKKLKIQNENLKLSLQNISTQKSGNSEELDKYLKFTKKLYSLMFTELKRRLQILKLSNSEKLLFRICGKSHNVDKFQQIKVDHEHNFDIQLKLKEILEITPVYLHLLQFKMQEENQNYEKDVLNYIYANIEKPLIIPTDVYIQQTLMQLQNFGEVLGSKKLNFEDMLPRDSEDIHYEVFEHLLQNYFEIDTLSSNVIVSHLLFKNRNFNLIKLDSILTMLYGSPEKSSEFLVSSDMPRIAASGPPKISRKMIYNNEGTSQRSQSQYNLTEIGAFMAEMQQKMQDLERIKDGSSSRNLMSMAGQSNEQNSKTLGEKSTQGLRMLKIGSSFKGELHGKK